MSTDVDERFKSEPPDAITEVVCAIEMPLPVVRAARVPRFKAVPVVRPEATKETKSPVVAITPLEVTRSATPVVRPFAVTRTTPVEVVALFAVTASTSPVVVIVPVESNEST